MIFFSVMPTLYRHSGLLSMFVGYFFATSMDENIEDFMKRIAEGAEGGSPFDGIDFGKELGLNAQQVEGLKAMFPKIANEFIQGAQQFAEEEKRMKEADQQLQKQVGDLLDQLLPSGKVFFK